ncbi:NAD(P)-binding protein [Aaosphaeria arxii CBS 175.79]|uniref:NAD(P)-binding protein n=1 Tax=Aaosphaeria arxii CBS 175.79 TaxID=1450172 RepID=A0A6A5X6M5_9PLEO|nr:NAD(P)-binding protein [Aaosphaeria arxii CBS 175.79]KAF2008434.1 NAD(P)-binding protein [Aaosphaeria arxii CBS 175.79]
MSSFTAPEQATRPIARVAHLPIDALKFALNEPIVTGGLLYLLTRGPSHIRDKMLQPLQPYLLSKNRDARLKSLVVILQALTALGLAKRVNRALNRLALNNWTLGRPGTPFRFGSTKEEVVLITGGSSGFGFEMVKLFAEKARVIVLDIMPGVFYYECDVTDTPAVVSLCHEIRRSHGNPTVLINNAGIGIGKTVLETTNEQCEKLFKVNLISHFVLIREFLPGMLQKKRGHIVTIASMASFVAAPGLLDYCCSKVGALYLSDGIRAECLSRYPGGEGICTTSVHPSWHTTGILKGAEKTLNKHGIYPDPPINVARVVFNQVLAGKSGRIHVPASEEGKAGARNWPLWVQDILMGYVFKRKDSFGFGSNDDSKMIK